MSSLREVYDKIAPGRYNVQHWTRFQPELEEMAARWQNGRLLNLGCGHGSDFLAFKEGFDLYGLDFSSVMLELAGKFAKKFDLELDLVQGDVSRIPFKDESFDWAISVATYHHLETPEARMRAFTELKRILKPGGEAFVTVWNRWRPQRDCSRLKFWFMGKEAQVPWKRGDETLSRYYYFFTYHEFEKLAHQSGFRVVRSFPENAYRFPLKYFSRNICLLVKKGAPITSGRL